MSDGWAERQADAAQRDAEQRQLAKTRADQLEEICQWALTRLPERYRETFKAKLAEAPEAWAAKPRDMTEVVLSERPRNALEREYRLYNGAWPEEDGLDWSEGTVVAEEHGPPEWEDFGMNRGRSKE